MGARQRRRTVLGLLVAAGCAAAVGAVALAASSGSGGPVHRPLLASRLGWRAFSHWKGSLQPGHGSPSERPTATSPSDKGVERVLAYTPYVQLAGRHRREIALTFDDGPNPPYTNAILRILRRMHVQATFFVIGRWVRAYPRLVRAELRGGNALGDHTETHPMLPALAPRLQDEEIRRAAADIRRVEGRYPVLMRPPYGAFNAATLRVLHALRLLLVMWSADTRDYARPGAARIALAALSGARPGAIILMHDGGGDRSQTVAALPRIITGLRRRGFRLVTLPRLLAGDPPPHRPAKRRPRGRD